MLRAARCSANCYTFPSYPRYKCQHDSSIIILRRKTHFPVGNTLSCRKHTSCREHTDLRPTTLQLVLLLMPEDVCI